MKRKVKSVLVLFFAATIITIGTGIIMAQNFKIPVSSYLALDLTVLLNQKPVPADNPQGTTSQLLTTQNTIDSDLLLNLTKTKTTKESVQSQINKGFKTWMLKSLQRLLSSLNADNETKRSLFFQFLSENPKYRELFKQYDRLLSEEIQASMLKQAKETFQYTDLLLNKGEVVKEWNTTNTIDNTTYTYMFKDYALDINGTTQHILKVSVYANDGTLIVDPYINIVVAPLIYFVFGWVIVYGWEFGAYQHYTAGAETVAFLAAACKTLEDADDFGDIGTVISAFVTIAGLVGGPTNPFGAVVFVTGMILLGIQCAIKDLANKVWATINYVNMVNAAGDPGFGFMLYQNFHWVCAPQWWDPMSYTRFCAILYNGVVIPIVPLSSNLVCYMLPDQVSTYVSFLIWYNANVGFYRWVWVSPA